jgi:hypothetical protein
VPRSAPRGRSRRLNSRGQLRFQVLRVGFEIAVDSPAVERELRVLVQSAVQPEPPRATVRYDVRRGGDGAYEIFRDDVLEDVQFEPGQVLRQLYAEIQRCALAAWPQGTLLYAVTGRCRGERFLLVGETPWDRSRVALHLLCLGVDIEGDGLAILHDGAVTAIPRPLRVCGGDAPLPTRAPPRDELPCVGSNAMGPWVLDLARAGIDWRITRGAPHLLVVLETNWGGQTRVAELAAHETARMLMSGSTPLGAPVEWIRAVARLADGPRCTRLWLGSLEHLKEVWPGRLP